MMISKITIQPHDFQIMKQKNNISLNFSIIIFQDLF